MCPPRMLQLRLHFAAPTSVLPVVWIRRHKDFWRTAGGICPCPARGVLSLGVFQGQSWSLGVPRKAAAQPPWGTPHVLCPTDTKPPAGPAAHAASGCAFHTRPWPGLLSPPTAVPERLLFSFQTLSVLTLCLKLLSKTPDRDNHPSLYFRLCPGIRLLLTASLWT